MVIEGRVVICCMVHDIAWHDCGVFWADRPTSAVM